MGRAKRYRVYAEFTTREERDDIVAYSKNEAYDKFIDEMFGVDGDADNIVIEVLEVLGPKKKSKKRKK